MYPKCDSDNILHLTSFRYLTDVGHQVINRQTGMPLLAGSEMNWEYEHESKRIIGRKHGRALYRGWTQIMTQTPNHELNQKWSFELVRTEFHITLE